LVNSFCNVGSDTNLFFGKKKKKKKKKKTFDQLLLYQTTSTQELHTAHPTDALDLKDDFLQF